jgi:hypothetical protein
MYITISVYVDILFLSKVIFVNISDLMKIGYEQERRAKIDAVLP